MELLPLTLSTFLLLIGCTAVHGEETCRNWYEDESCEAFKAWRMCKSFKRQCEKTCGVCTPAPTEEPKPRFWFVDPVEKSACTKSCGVGTRYTFDSSKCTAPRKLSCKRTFEECNTDPCVYRACRRNQEERYGGNTGCCNRRGPGSPKKSSLKGFSKENKWPWMAIVTSFGDVCGGVLIHRQWVFTSAHCLTSGSGRIDPRRIFVHLGVESVKETSLRSRYRTRRTYIHPQYDELENSVGLIKLIEPSYLRHVIPLSLPRSEETPQDSTCIALGWGLSEDSRSKSRRTEHLEERPLQILDMNVCRNAYEKDPIITDMLPERRKSRWMCAGSISEKNEVCRGDKGVPLVCQRCTSCDWYLAGMTSFNLKGACGKRRSPGLYAKLTAYEAWICRIVPSLIESKVRCPYKYGP